MAHTRAVREFIVDLMGAGTTSSDLAKVTGLSRHTLAKWKQDITATKEVLERASPLIRKVNKTCEKLQEVSFVYGNKLS